MPYPYEFKDEDFPPSYALCIRRTTSLPTVEATLAELFAQVAAYLREIAVEPSGPPVAFYHAITEREVDVEAGLTIDRVIPPHREIRTVELAGGPAVSLTLSRADEPVSYAEEAMRGWLDKQCMGAVGPLIEVRLSSSSRSDGLRRGPIKLIQRVEAAPLEKAE
jgi:hypothetical protein